MRPLNLSCDLSLQDSSGGRRLAASVSDPPDLTALAVFPRDENSAGSARSPGFAPALPRERGAA